MTGFNTRAFFFFLFFLILPTFFPAGVALLCISRRVRPSLSLVNGELGLCVLTSFSAFSRHTAKSQKSRATGNRTPDLDTSLCGLRQLVLSVPTLHQFLCFFWFFN